MSEPAEPHPRTLDLGGNLHASDVARIIDSGPFGYVTAGHSELIDGINSTLLQWLGRELDSLVGKQTFQDLLAPGDRIYYDTHVRPMLAMSHEVNEIAMQLVRSDGTRLPVLMNSLLRIDEDGHQRVEAVVIDATERRRYEQELLRERQTAESSEARLQLMYDVVSGLAGADSVDSIVAVVTERAERSIDGATCSVWLFDAGLGTVFRANEVAETSPALHELPGGGPALVELLRGDLVVLEDVDEPTLDYPFLRQVLREAGHASAAVAPLLSNGVLHGVINYGFAEPHLFDESERIAALSLAAQTEQALERARSIEAERRSRDRLESLFRFSSRLAGALTVDDVLQVIIGVSVDLLDATSVRLALLSDDGTSVRFVPRTGQAEDDERTLDIESNAIACAVIRTGEVRILESMDELRALYPDSPLLEARDVGRVIAVPLVRDKEVLGAWVLAYAMSRPPDAGDVTLVHLFAEQASQATGRAFFHENEAAARAQADVRLAISAALNAAVTTEDVAEAITIQGRNAFDASQLAVYMIYSNTPESLRLIASVGFDDTLPSPADIAATGELMDAVADSLAPLYLEGAQVQTIEDGFASQPWDAVVLLPMSVSGNLMGLVVVGFDDSAAVTPGTRAALAGLSAEAGSALGRARRYELEHEVAVTLQESLLPTELGEIDGWSVSARYEPASDHLLVGGDLFDVIRTDDDRIVVIVGDVVGHGLRAAASMGQLRSAARALALVSSGPLEILQGLEAFAKITPGVMWSTVACVTIDPKGDGRYACAGHPYPILVRSDGKSELLEGGRTALLGLSNDPPSVASFHMDEGACLVLYTDGVIELNTQNIDEGIEHLRSTLAHIYASEAQIDADTIVDTMLDGSDSRDDIVVVCVTRAAGLRDQTVA